MKNKKNKLQLKHSIFSLMVFAISSHSIASDSSFLSKIYHKLTPHHENTSAAMQSGFYIGGNAGGWWTSDRNINQIGTPNFGAPVGPLDQARMLSIVGTNHFSIDSSGFIGGGEIGYNYFSDNGLVLGLETDIQGLSQSQTKQIKSKRTNSPRGAINFYLSDISINKNLNFLGTLRGRLGTFLTPKLFAFGTGGMAYGGVSLNTQFLMQDQGQPDVLPGFSIQNKVSKTLVGWTAGGGFEWAFLPNWSAKIEGLYYDLGTLNNNLELEQYVNNPGAGQVGLFATAKVLTSTVFANGLVRVGVNYHFS